MSWCPTIWANAARLMRWQRWIQLPVRCINHFEPRTTRIMQIGAQYILSAAIWTIRVDRVLNEIRISRLPKQLLWIRARLSWRPDAELQADRTAFQVDEGRPRSSRTPTRGGRHERPVFQEDRATPRLFPARKPKWSCGL